MVVNQDTVRQFSEGELNEIFKHIMSYMHPNDLLPDALAMREWEWFSGQLGDYELYNTKSHKDYMKEIIHSRRSPAIIIPESKRPICHTNNIKEIRARQTLERVLGKKHYKEFIRKGFISIKAKSSLIYQIFPAHGITNVYQNGEMIERLCVVLQGDFPPTDSLIMRYLLILNDEQDFRKHAVKHEVIKFQRNKRFYAVDTRSLPEIYKSLKVA